MTKSSDLVLDLGNTHLTVALYRDGAKEGIWRLSTDQRRTSDEWAILLRSLVSAPVLRAAIASVVPAATEPLRVGIQRAFGVAAQAVDWTTPGVRVDVEVPGSVGPDRLANAAGVRAKGILPAIVVDFGTATNVDVVDRRGFYVGGAIAPGLGVAADALVQKAARLPAFPLSPPERAIGKNTVDCLRSGVVFGFAGLVDALVERIRLELPGEATVVATGGHAELLFGIAKSIGRVEPDLTIDGIWELLREGDRHRAN